MKWQSRGQDSGTSRPTALLSPPGCTVTGEKILPERDATQNHNKKTYKEDPETLLDNLRQRDESCSRWESSSQ